MDFTKDNFIKFCNKIAQKGIAIDLEQFCGGFGYFEMNPYADKNAIRYNIEKIENTSEGISLTCSVRIREFNICSNCVVDEETFLRYAKEIRLHGHFSKELINIYNSL